jgi:protease-4
MTRKSLLVLLVVGFWILLFTCLFISIKENKKNLIVTLNSESSRSGLEVEPTIQQIKDGLRVPFVKNIIIRVNSAGGKLPQGELLYNFINQVKQSGISVYAVIENECQSACYYGISGSNFIYSGKQSAIGYIGTIFIGPVFQKSSDPIPVVVYSGKFKYENRENEDQLKKHMNNSAKIAHLDMIKDIKKGRQGRLKGTNDQLFEGLSWTGIEAKDLGLIDDFGDINTVLNTLRLE